MNIPIVLYYIAVAMIFVYLISRTYFGNVNFFGGPSSTTAKVSAKLQKMEQENDDAMFVFLSDVWLDDVQVINTKLK